MIYVRLVVLSTSPQNVANMWQRKNMLGRLIGLDLMEIESTKTWQECKQNKLVNVLPIQTEKNHPEAPQGIFFPLVVYGFWPSHRNPWNCRQTRTTNQRHAGGGGGLSASSPAKRYSYRTAMTKCQGKQEREEENKRNHFTLCDPCHGIYPDIYDYSLTSYLAFYLKLCLAFCLTFYLTYIQLRAPESWQTRPGMRSPLEGIGQW